MWARCSSGNEDEHDASATAGQPLCRVYVLFLFVLNNEDLCLILDLSLAEPAALKLLLLKPHVLFVLQQFTKLFLLCFKCYCYWGTISQVQTDKASMLDDGIEYLKQLQLQLQVTKLMLCSMITTNWDI
jgi:hypothetical protein